MLTLLTCQPQAQGETLPEYASRVLRFALRYGPEYLTREQLQHADHCAQLEICSLPVVMTEDQGRRYVLLTRTRRALAEDYQRREASRLQDARMLAAYAAEQEAGDLETTPDPTGDTDTDQARALRLLRAALILVMNDQGNGGGSQGARLTPPPRIDPTPGGPNSTRADDAPILAGGRF